MQVTSKPYPQSTAKTRPFSVYFSVRYFIKVIFKSNMCHRVTLSGKVSGIGGKRLVHLLSLFNKSMNPKSTISYYH